MYCIEPGSFSPHFYGTCPVKGNCAFLFFFLVFCNKMNESFTLYYYSLCVVLLIKKMQIEGNVFLHELCFPTAPNDPLVPTAVLGEDLVLHLCSCMDFHLPAWFISLSTNMLYVVVKQLVLDNKKLGSFQTMQVYSTPYPVY